MVKTCGMVLSQTKKTQNSGRKLKNIHFYSPLPHHLALGEGIALEKKILLIVLILLPL